MSITKNAVSLFNAVAIGNGDSDTSSMIDLTDEYSAGLYLKAVNGAAAPAVQGEFQVLTSTVSDDVWYQNGANIQCSIDSAGEYSWGPIVIPAETGWLKINVIAPSGGGSGMTVDVEVLKISTL